MDRWIELPRLKCLRWIRTGNIKVNNFWLGGPIMPCVIREAMQYPDGPVIMGWTRLSVTVDMGCNQEGLG